MRTELTTDHDSLARPPAQASIRPRRRRAFGVALVTVAVVVAVVVTDPFRGSGTANTAAIDSGYRTSTATVVRQDLSSQTNVDATLDYAASYSIVNQAQGTLTGLPALGETVSQGQVLYQVNSNPVVLLYGATPAYRSLSDGATASDMTGTDVAELNSDLVALGYATTAEIPPGSDEFSWWTKQAVEKLQAHLGVTQTGTLTLGQEVFLPGPARVTAVNGILGAPAPTGGPVLTASSTDPQVTVALDAAQQSEVTVGDKVIITLPNNQTTRGVVSSVGTVATVPSGGGTPTITVEVTLTNPSLTGGVDQAPVTVSITTATVKDVLVVPVDALLALSGGGYAVEVVEPDGLHHLVAVSLGLFDDADGLVAVTGAILSAGQHVVVPTL